MATFYSDLRDLIAFDERLTALADLIGSVTRPGDYCTRGRSFAPMPRVQVASAGDLSFPIPLLQVQAMIAGAERAPYGRSQETVVDRSVRDCWQIEPGELGVGGHTWADTFAQVLDRARDGLGCPKGSVAAELYKLLIYEPGGFFLPHRDTEKADGMVATLVVSLPVAGTGGELAIRHLGRETVVDMRTDEPSELVYAAFYADCEHEILPITDGHRVCLVYNLILQEGSGIPADAPDYGAEIDLIAAELGARFRDAEASGKLVWLMEHDYSMAGLSFATLKNADAAIGRALSAAAEQAGCALHAAIVHVEESGSAEYDGYVDEVEDIGDDEYELIEVDDVQCWLDSWVRPDGDPADYGVLPLSEGELMPPGRLDPDRPDTQRLLEASGNVGATIERLYRRAALVVWPKADSPRLLAQAGAGTLAAFLEGEWQRASEASSASDPTLRNMISQVVDVWPSCDSHRMRRDGDTWHEQSAKVLELLSEIGDRDATQRFLRDVVMLDYDAQFNSALTIAASEMGAAEMRDYLCALVISNFSRRPEGIVDLASLLCERLVNGADEAWRDALQQMVSTMCTQMPSVHRHWDGGDRAGPYVLSTRRVRKPLSARTVQKFFALLWGFGMASEADATAALLVQREDLASPDRTIPPALEALLSSHRAEARASAAFDAIWRHSTGFLLSRSGAPPLPPTDWLISSFGLTCDCEYCAQLRRFCDDADAEVCRIPVRKDLRKHLRREIERAGTDIRCETVRTGSPYTLVCIKTRATYERRRRQYDEDIAEMRRLLRAAEFVSDPAGLSTELGAAIQRSR